MKSTKRTGTPFRMLVAAAALFFILFSGLAAANTANPQKDAAKAQFSADELSDKWGIEITSLRMAAHNHMVDFRFRVLDTAKADPLFNRNTKPYLLDQKTGKVLAVPNTAKVGPLRNSNKPKQGRVYWMFFGNHTGLIQQGSEVTVIIGEFKAENLVVK